MINFIPHPRQITLAFFNCVIRALALSVPRPSSAVNATTQHQPRRTQPFGRTTPAMTKRTSSLNPRRLSGEGKRHEQLRNQRGGSNKKHLHAPFTVAVSSSLSQFCMLIGVPLLTVRTRPYLAAPTFIPDPIRTNMYQLRANILDKYPRSTLDLPS